MPKKELNSGNHTSRIGEDFCREIEAIKQERIDIGMDKKKKSTRILTELIIKHDDWPTIKEDLVHLKLKGEPDE